MKFASLLAASALTGCVSRATPDSVGSEVDSVVSDSGSVEPAIACPDVPWVDVSVGGFLVCGVHEGGCGECWGRSADWHHETRYYGDAEIPQSLVWTDVELRDRLGEPSGHGCGVTIDGTATCWGRSDEGQADPPQIRVTDLSLSQFSTCALQEDGRPLCWGADEWVEQTPDAQFAKLSSSLSHCGLTASGDVTCWGKWIDGGVVSINGLGARDIAATEEDVWVVIEDRAELWFSNLGKSEFEVGVDANSTAYCAGGCYLAPDGRVDCAANGDGYLANPPNELFMSLSCEGSRAACGVTTAGHIKCWGLGADSPDDNPWFDVPGSFD